MCSPTAAFLLVFIGQDRGAAVHKDYAKRTQGRVCLTTAFDICNPLDAKSSWHSVPAEGIGLGDFVAGADVDFVLDDGLELAVVQNGKALTLPEADEAMVQAGDNLVLRIVPAGGGGGGGGGSNPLQIIASVALVILAAVATWYVGGTGGIAVAGMTSLKLGATAGYLAGAAVMIGGSLLMSVAFPSVNPSLGSGFGLGSNALDESPTYRWSAQSNPSEQGGVIPIVQGDCQKITPVRLCSYIKTDGEKQYYNALYLVAEGQVDEIYDVLVNDNPVRNYAGIELTTRLGTADQEVIPEFADLPQEYGVGVKLKAKKDDDEGWHTVLFAGTGISRIGLGINAVQGLYYANNGGGLDPISVTAEFEYRLEGESAWQPLMLLTLKDAKRSAVMSYAEACVSRNGERSYEVRGRMQGSPPTGTRYMSDVTWEYYHEIIEDDFRLPHCALLAIKALPTESLSGGAPTIKCSVKRMTAMLPDASGTWAARPLSNPAWAIMEMALAKRYGVGEQTKNIDAESFALAAEWCDKKKIQGGLYIDAAMTFETFAGYWGQLGRCTVDRMGTQLVCVSDRPQEYPDAAFLATSADIEKGSLGITYPALEDRADGFEITYFDAKRGKTSLFSPSDTFFRDKDRPPVVSAITLYPCRDEATAINAGKYLNRCNQYLTRVVQLTLGWQALGPHLRRGKVFQLAADMLLNTQSGLVLEASSTMVRLNRPVRLEAGLGYELVLRHSDQIDERTQEPLVERMPLLAVEKATESDSLHLAAPLLAVPAKDVSAAVGVVKRTVRWYRVQSLTQTGDLKVQLTGLEYDEAIYADEGGQPSTDGAGDWYGVAGLTAAILDAKEDDVVKKLISLSWRGYALGWRVFWRRLGVDNGWIFAGSTSNPSFVVRNLSVGYIYRFSVTEGANAQEGMVVDVDFRLDMGSGVIFDVYVGESPVVVSQDGQEQSLQAVL
jgi:hypothetical protein